jgi:hypothetical protein
MEVHDWITWITMLQVADSTDVIVETDNDEN